MTPRFASTGLTGLTRILGLPSASALWLLLVLCAAPASLHAQDLGSAPQATPIEEPAPPPDQGLGDPFAASPLQMGASDPFSLGLVPFDPAGLMDGFCRAALAATTCKSPEKYNFVDELKQDQDRNARRAPAREQDKKDRVLVFSGFYGASYAQFYCQIADKRVILSSPAWGSKRISVPHAVDEEKRCLTANVRVEACGGSKAIEICEEQPE